jgi:hypothetical protein
MLWEFFHVPNRIIKSWVFQNVKLYFLPAETQSVPGNLYILKCATAISSSKNKALVLMAKPFIFQSV